MAVVARWWAEVGGGGVGGGWVRSQEVGHQAAMLVCCELGARGEH